MSRRSNNVRKLLGFSFVRAMERVAAVRAYLVALIESRNCEGSYDHRFFDIQHIQTVLV